MHTEAHTPKTLGGIKLRQHKVTGFTTNAVPNCNPVLWSTTVSVARGWILQKVARHK